MSRSLTLGLILLLAMTHAAAQRWRPPTSSQDEGCQSKYRSAPVLQNPAFTSGQGDEFDATYYHLDLTVTPSPAFLAGRVRMRGEIRADSLREVLLDLSAPMTIDSVVSLGKRLPFTRYAQSFSVALPQTARQGADVTLDVFYHGTPVPTGFGSFVFSSFEGDPWVWSLSQPYGARDWWPCNDHPLDKADSVDIWITCSAGLKVGSNGKLMGIRTNGNGTRTHMWSERYPIASYLVSVAVANYAEFSNWFRYSSTDSLQILNYVLPHNLAEAQRTLPKTVNMLEIFSGLYGPYPFLKEKYGHSEFGRGGAMEHQTMTSTITFEEDVVAHELAHQWFGDLITCANWQHLWLNEGFATYSEALYREQRYGPAEYWRLMQARLTSALNAQGSLYLRDTSSVAEMFAASRVYAKGASVLHMLRHVLGDSLFFRSLRAYADDPRYRYANVTTEGFRSVCEQVSGTNLTRFFEQWVYGENYPRYYVSWKTQPDGDRHRVLLHVRQETRTNTPQFFSMPVDCKVSGAGIDTTMVLRNDSLVQDFTFTVGFKPDRLEIDPNGWILREVFDENAPLPTQVRLDQNYPNPFNAGTTIAFHLPHRSPVTLSIYNVMGELIAVPVDEQREPGFHTATWKGVFSSGVMAPSGVYFYRLVAEGSQITRRMILLR